MTRGGPHLVREAGPHTAAAFGSLWVDVTRAGGAVRFRVDTGEDEIRAAAEREIAQVAAGSQHLMTLTEGELLLGTVLVRRGGRQNVEHRGELLLLMVRPELQRRGHGTVLLEAAVAHARGLGLDQLLLSARGGTHLPAWYRACGWTEVGVWRAALKIDGDELRDEHWFQLMLG